jgi:hypothetical protein
LWRGGIWQGNAKQLPKLQGVAYNSNDAVVQDHRTLSIWLERTDARAGLWRGIQLVKLEVSLHH